MTETEVLRLLESAIMAARAGDQEEAYLLLRRVIDADPDNVIAWLWLAGVTESHREGNVALKRVQQLDPDNPRLAEARAWLEQQGRASSIDDSEATAEVSDQDGEVVDFDDLGAEPEARYWLEQQSWASSIDDSGVTTELSNQDGEDVDFDDLGAEPEALVAPFETWAIEAETEETPEYVETGPIVRPAEPNAATPSGRTGGRSGRLLLLLTALMVLLLLLAFGLAQCSGIAGAQAGPTPIPTQTSDQRLEALQPKFKQAVAEGRWQDALAVLQVMRALAPQDISLDRDSAFVAYKLAVEHRHAGEWEAAQKALGEALKYAPDNQQALLEQEHLQQMLEGQRLHAAGDWQQAVTILGRLYQEEPGYGSVAELLYAATCKEGDARQAAGDLPAAQAAYQAALEILPGDPLAQEKLREVALLLNPPTPTSTPTATAAPTSTPTPAPTGTPTPTLTPTPDPARQRIEVDVSDQRMYVYQDELLVWDWVCSTGEPGKDTATGAYAIQSKISMAYASTWDLDMPFWLGVYQSGPLENGIHALPIQRANGAKLWEGYLGQRVSYGCIILSDENAQTLFNWAQIGTPVVIRW